MLEATPGKPWGIGLKDLLDVEPNMKLRLVTMFAVVFRGSEANVIQGESLRRIICMRMSTQLL